MDFYRGNSRLLYILMEGEYLPVGCLTSDSFIEQTDFIPGASPDGKWEGVRPTMQRFSVEFSGLVVNTRFYKGDYSKLSYDNLIEIKRTMQLRDWRLATEDGSIIQDFKAYIGSISDSAGAGEMLSFNGSLVGYGVL